MNRRLLRIFIPLLLVFAMVWGVSVVSNAAESGSKLVFSGITMRTVTDADGESVQGFLDVSVRNIENAGVSFTLQYDSRYVEISNAATNAVPNGNITYFDTIIDMGLPCPYIKWNETDFSANTFGVSGQIIKNTNSTLKDTEPQMNTVEFNIVVKQEATGKYLRKQDIEGYEAFGKDTNIVVAKDATLRLGSISFKIVDPQAFAKLNAEELRNVFRVATDADDGTSQFLIACVDNSTYPPIIYYDEETYLAYEFAVENAVDRVEVNRNDQETNAAEIFVDGVASDLLAWMDNCMGDVTVIYADGTRISDTVKWSDGKAGVDYSISPDYKATGGEYTVTRHYNNDVDVVAKVKVANVTALGFTCENEYLAYNTAEELPAGTSPEAVLSLPKGVQAVFDTVVPGKTDVVWALDTDGWECVEAPDGVDKKDMLAIKNGVTGIYKYTTEIGEVFPAWATKAADLDGCITIVRVLGEITPEPVFVAEVTDDGWLVIDISAVGESSNLADYEFGVRLPTGLVLSETMFKDKNEQGEYANYNVTHNDDGSVKICIKSEGVGSAEQEALLKAINLGGKLGNFGLCAIAKELPQSKWVDFATEPRSNKYKAGIYEFDYTLAAQIFSIGILDDGTLAELPLTIALPQGDAVGITYSGITGLEPGELSTVTVDETSKWTMTVVKQAGAELAVGDVVKFSGKLKNECVYADHGMVINPDDVRISVILKVTDGNDLADEMIDELEDIVFSKMQVGYSEVESRSVTIKNIGEVDIDGLTMSLTPDPDCPGSENAFTLQQNLPFKLVAGKEATLKIERNLGLPSGTYAATVTVGSNRNAILKQFHVSVKIVEGVVYKLEISVEPSDGSGGLVNTADGEYYEVGETVTLFVSPHDDYRFGGWSVLNISPESIDFVQSAVNSNQYSFKMPDLSDHGVEQLKILAKFVAGDMAGLRLQDLHLFNPDGSENELLLQDDGKYAKLEFDPLVCDYYAIVPADAESNRVEFEFGLSDDLGMQIGDVNIKLYLDSRELVKDTDWYYDSANEKYVVESLPLSEYAPQVNNFVIELSRVDADDVSRSYTLNIIRKLPLENMLQMEYGNSPFGLIMKHTEDNEDVNSDLWKEEFRMGNCFVDGEGHMGAPNGATLGVVYTPQAWGVSAYVAAMSKSAENQDVANYDRNDYALFVYCGGEIADPGVKAEENADGIKVVKNSLGEDVPASSVKRKIYGLAELTSQSDKLTEVFKQSSLYDLELSADGKANLTKKVRPGVYNISYEFEDYDGSTVVVTRPMVVVCNSGDVNMDGKVDANDGTAILNRYNSVLPHGLAGYESNCRIYLYRVCDVNCDGYINIGDRNVIRKQMAVQFYK